MSGCVFCGVASGEMPASVLAQGEDFVAFRDINPVAPFHALVIPRAHVASVVETPAAVVARLVEEAVRLGKERSPGGFRLIVNAGEDGGQSVHHLHVHVIGGKRLKWPQL